MFFQKRSNMSCVVLSCPSRTTKGGVKDPELSFHRIIWSRSLCEMDHKISLTIVKEEPPEPDSENFIQVEIKNDNEIESCSMTKIKQEKDQNWTCDNLYDTSLVVCKEEIEALEIAALDEELKDNVKNQYIQKTDANSNKLLGGKLKTSNQLDWITRLSKKLKRTNHQTQEADQNILPSKIKDEPIMKETFVDIKIEYDKTEESTVHDEVKEELLSPKWAETCGNDHKSYLVSCKDELWDNRLEMERPQTDINSPADCKKRKLHLAKSMKREISLESSNFNKKLIFKCANKADAVKMGSHKKTFTCIICDYSCSQKKNLVNHMMSHTGEKPFSCNVCSYKSRYKAHLVIHKRTHTGEKPFPCSYCKYAFSRKQNLVKHIRTHTGEKPFACNVCTYMCSQKQHLVSHMRTHTGEKPFSCNICTYRSQYKTHLVDHLRSHTGEKTFSCSLCDFKCGLRQNLVQHEKTHTGEKPFSCSLCDFKCGRKQNLITHIRTHTGEKPFSCNICDYKCGRKQNLIDHVRTHTGEKPFNCTFCDNKFGRKQTLVKHMRIHTGEKPYSCEVCEYRTRCKTHLLDHMLTHTGEKPFSCDLCNYKCIQKRHLVNHMSSRHMR